MPPAASQVSLLARATSLWRGPAWSDRYGKADSVLILKVFSWRASSWRREAGAGDFASDPRQDQWNHSRQDPASVGWYRAALQRRCLCRSAAWVGARREIGCRVCAPGYEWSEHICCSGKEHEVGRYETFAFREECLPIGKQLRPVTSGLPDVAGPKQLDGTYSTLAQDRHFRTTEIGNVRPTGAAASGTLLRGEASKGHGGQ
ncbi:MAG: hypothetical protein KatS3mg077_1596 [Candidatus Binatia bacterium]|nr:MAG: hypothetical protein KatS3mg077_1596 [Candidatus Binatia bacterium]